MEVATTFTYVDMCVLAIVVLVGCYFISGLKSTVKMSSWFNRKILNNHSGWMLVEAIIGITVISVGILAIAASYIQTTKSASYTDHATQATYLAQQKLERIKKDFDGGTTPAACPVPADSPSGIYSFSCSTATATLPVTGLNIAPITYTVSWTDASSTQPNTVSLTAYYYYFDS